MPLLGAGMGKQNLSLKAANPAINDAVTRISERRHSRKPVIPVQDA
jgi:hypothetical protein